MGVKKYVYEPCTFPDKHKSVQTRSQVGRLVLHSISPCLSCQNRQGALAHTRTGRGRDSECLCQHTHPALLKTLAKAYTAPNCLSKYVPMWCLSASPGS